VPAGSKWILRNISWWCGQDLNNAEVTVVSIQPASGRRAVVALKSGETMSVSLKCLHEMPPALDLDEPGPESEPLASGDPGMERHCEASRADMHMAFDSDSQLANLEQGEPEQELDSQMTDAPYSPEPAHSSINPSERSSLGPHSES
jgi:hypothetical protein